MGSVILPSGPTGIVASDPVEISCPVTGSDHPTKALLLIDDRALTLASLDLHVLCIRPRFCRELE